MSNRPAVPVPITDPFDLCFVAVANAMKGKPGAITALLTITAAKAGHVCRIPGEYPLRPLSAVRQ